MSTPTTSFPLETLIHRLEREGFIIGVDTHLKIQTVLRKLGQDFTEEPQSVKYILAPVIAHSQEGQQHFFKVFDEYYHQIVEPSIEQHLSKEKISLISDLPEVDPGVKMHTSKWRWLIPFIAVVVLGGTALGLLLIQNLQSNQLELEPVFDIIRKDGTIVEEGDTVYVNEELQFRNRTLEIAERKLKRLGKPEELSAIRFSWDFGNGSAEETFNNPEFAYTEEGYFPISLKVIDSTESPPTVLTSVQSIRVLCKNKPHLLRFEMDPAKPVVAEPVRIRIQTRPSQLNLRWSKNKVPQGSIDREITTLFSEEGQYIIRITGEIKGLASEGSCAILDTSLTIDIVKGDPPVFLESWQLQEDTGGSKQVSFSYWLTLFPTLLLMSLIFLGDYFWGRRKRSRIIAEQQKHFQLKKGGPFMLTLPEKDPLLTPNHQVFSLAKILRQRREGEKKRLDVPKTIQETARSLGMPQFRYLTTSKASEYLVLIEQSYPESHLTKLFNRLVSMLKGEDVVLEIFFFDQDMRICWNDDFPDGITLVQLKQRFSRHRLLIYSDGHHMVDPFESQIADWVPVSINIWKSRLALVTPVTVADWGYKERLLSEYMEVMPADINCQNLIVERLIAQQSTPFEEQKKAYLDVFPETDETLTNYDFNRVEDIRIYLSDPLYEWVSATMVYPVPNWQVTLAIGRALSDRPGAPFLLSYSNLLRISRIPWMQTGLRPAQMRLVMLDSLAPATEYISRKTVLRLLDEVKVNPNSLAAHKLNIQRISNRFLTAPGDEEIAKKMYYLWQDDKLADQALVNRMAKPAPSMNGSTAVEYLSARFQGLNWLKTTARAMLAAVIIGIATFFLHKNYDQSAQLKKWDDNWNLREMGLTRYQMTVDSAVHMNNIGVEAYKNGRWLKARKAFWRALIFRYKQRTGERRNSRVFTWNWERDQRYEIKLDMYSELLLRLSEIDRARIFDREIERVFSADNPRLTMSPQAVQYPWGEESDYPDIGMLAFHLMLKEYPVAGKNLLTVMKLNSATEIFNQLKYKQAYHRFYQTQLLANEINDSLRMQGLHGMGLCNFYEGRIRQALDVQHKIEEISPEYFDQKLPPHLKSLLSIYVQDSIENEMIQDSLLAKAREDSIRRDEQIRENDLKIEEIRARLDSLNTLKRRLENQLSTAQKERARLKMEIEYIEKGGGGSVQNREIARQEYLISQLRDSLKWYNPGSFDLVRQHLEKQQDYYGRRVASLYYDYKKIAYSRKKLPFQDGKSVSDPELSKIQSQIMSIIRGEYSRLKKRLLTEQDKLNQLEYKIKTDKNQSNPKLQDLTKRYQSVKNRISILEAQLKKVNAQIQVANKALPAAAY